MKRLTPINEPAIYQDIEFWKRPEEMRDCYRFYLAWTIDAFSLQSLPMWELPPWRMLRKIADILEQKNVKEQIEKTKQEMEKKI